MGAWKNRHLTITSKVRATSLSSYLFRYTPLKFGPCLPPMWKLEAFHMKCQRLILQAKWQQFVRNEDDHHSCMILSPVVVTPSSATLPDSTATCQRTKLSESTSTCHLANYLVQAGPGRRRCRWIDQIWKDNSDTPPADLWRHDVVKESR